MGSTVTVQPRICSWGRCARRACSGAGAVTSTLSDSGAWQVLWSRICASAWAPGARWTRCAVVPGAGFEVVSTVPSARSSRAVGKPDSEQPVAELLV